MIRRMKVMSKVSVIVGLLLVLVGLAGAIWAGWLSYRQWLALDALRRADVQSAGLPLLIGAAGLLVGGFFTGLGLGRPRRELPVQTPPAA